MDWLTKPFHALRRGSPQQGALLLASLAGLSILLGTVHAHYPLGKWLVWRYLGYMVCAVIWSGACLNVGYRVLAALEPIGLRWVEQLVVAKVLGVLVFFLGVFAVGLVGGLYWPMFIALPLILGALGGTTLLRKALRVLRRLRRLERPKRRSVVASAALAFGLLSLIAIYLGIMHPENASFDARWYHLGLAEHYAASGAIRRSDEGLYAAMLPHLTSVLFAWAFLLPRSELFDRVELSAHLEFVLFVWTLVGVAAMVHRLVGRRVPFAWAATFLFPGIFVYDSGLHLGGDHVAAFFAPAVALLCFAIASRDSSRRWIVLAAACSGATLTKYTAVLLLAAPLVGLCLLTIWRSFAAARERGAWAKPWIGPGAGLATGLLLTAPHWLKNWVWYGNPVYPFASGYFPNRPWNPFTADVLAQFIATNPWATHGPLQQQWLEALSVLPTFAFFPHDWATFHGVVPVFGFLFSLSALLLPFLKVRPQVWAVVLWAHVGVFIWYLAMHQDRYLQILMPWMAAGTAAVLSLAWRTGGLARLGVAALVLAQVAWGADCVLTPGHAMLGKPPILRTADLLGQRHTQQYDPRLTVYEPYSSVGRWLPPGSKVLLHSDLLRTGFNAPVIQDTAHVQGAIGYGAYDSPHQIYELAKGMGVTHVAWKYATMSGWEGYASEFLFIEFLRRHTKPTQTFSFLQVAELKDAPDVDLSDAKVVYLGCPLFPQGLYRLKQLNFSMQIPPSAGYPTPERALGPKGSPDELIKQARYVAHDPSCHKALHASVQRDFDYGGSYVGTARLWIRRAPPKR